MCYLAAMQQMTSIQLYLRLLRYVKPYGGVFALSILGMLISAATEVALPVAVKPFLDGTFVDKDPFLMKWVPVALVVIFVFRGLGAYIGTYASSWVGNKVVMDLRDIMFRRMLALPLGYFHDNTTGNLISRFTYDVTQVTSAATNVVTVLVKDSLTIIGLLAYLLYLDWKLTMISLIMVPPIALVVRYFNVRLRNMSRATQQSMGDITQVLQETVECNKVVKIFGGHEYEANRFAETSNRLRGFSMKQTAAAAANVPIVQLLAALAVAVVVYYATAQAQANHTTVGGFVSFLAAMLMLTTPLKRLTGVAEHLQRGLAASESVFTLIDEAPEKDEGKVDLGRASGDIRFERVTFRYPHGEQPALLGVTLAIRPGETVALVGSSGSGKTSLANMVPRFFHAASGQITIDGHNLESLSLASLRRNIALVSQEVALFNDTVAANIAYGHAAGASREAIERAAQAAHALDFIHAMPQGLDTLIGENGVRLSGGQRQRLAIARTILKDAPILILDEATSALDSESEKHVQAALERLMQGRTTIVIAHRLSTIEKADRIVVLDKGEVAETGTHSELLAKGGIYTRLYSIQFALGAVVASPALQPGA
ncbi:MAG TPA: lipid A export permease/ATP-binding protein MsbA [Burkholderiales bacterium]|nr:lipid A export permease/ATP-binding protein MsbA [Burkholderiales bacterium]